MNKSQFLKKLRRAYIITLLSVFLLVGVSFAWYYSKISIGGGGLSTGQIGFVAYGYDESGTLKSTMVPQGMSTSGYANVNASIFVEEDWKAGDASTAYIAVERKGTIDIEFNVSFSASGADDVEENFMYLGGYWYEITEITSSMTAQTDAALKTYASNNKVVLCSETQCPNNKHTCTEKDGVGNYQNMNSIVTTKTQGVIKVGESIQKRYYRIDYGVRKEATPYEYTSKKIELFANVYVTQVGAIQNPDGIGIEYTVSTEAELKQAIIDSVPGDTILFASNITYTGDLIINKALNLNLASRTLTVKGNLTYSFTSEHNLKINLSGAGTIKVLMNAQSGGNFTLDTPNAQVEIIGTNTSGDLFVERICTLSASNDVNKGGCILSGVTIKDTVNESKEIYLKSDTKITLNEGCVVKRLEAKSEASNIQIVNNGVIEMLNLGSMFYSTMTDFPQIYIVNHGVINGLVLPTWSVVFKEQDGVYSGNTKIICSSGGIINNMTEVNGFKKNNIVYEGSSILVESVDGTYERLRVNYKNKAATVTTLKGLLEEYFTSLGYANSEAVSGCISRITYLEINALSGKYITSSDISFLNGGNFNKLETLNLKNANLENNTLKSNFINLATLQELILPKNLQVIEGTPFGTKVSLKELVIPESVTTIKYKGLTGVRYAIFQSNNVPSVELPAKTNDEKYTLGCMHVFTPEEAKFDYEYVVNINKEVDNPNLTGQNDDHFSWGTIKIPCYPISTLADDGVSFVKKLDDGTYELVLLDLAANPSVIVDNKYVVGQNLTINNEAIVVSKLGRYALSKNEFPSLELSFASSITTSSLKSLSDADFYSVDFSNIQTFGMSTVIFGEIEYLKFTNTKEITSNYAFLQTYAKSVDLGSVTRISGKYVFKDSNIIEVDTGNVTYLNSYSFYRCKKLKKFVAPNLTETRSNVLRECVSLLEVHMPNIETMSSNIFYGDSSLVYLNLGEKLNSVDPTILDSTPNLKYLYIGSTSTNALKINRLIKENPAIDYIFVNYDKYDSYYSAVYSTMKENLREYGVAVGEYKVNINNSSDNPYYINVGDYTVRVHTVTSNGTTTNYAVITSCNYTDEYIKYELTSYVIPKKLTVDGAELDVRYIGKRAFANTDIAPTSFNNVRTVYAYAFYNCDKLEVLYASKITTINKYAFAECDNLAAAILPAATKLYQNAFANCPSLASIYMQKSLTTSYANCFSGTTTNLRSITINLNSETVATNTAFASIANKNVDLCVLSECKSIYENDSVYSKFNIVGIDASVTNKSSTYFLRAISGTSNYEIISIKLGSTSLVIPNDEHIVSSKAGVYDYLPVKSITLPNTYESVKEGEFSNVIGLTEIKVDTGNTNFKASSGVLFSYSSIEGVVKELLCYPNSKTATSYSISSNVVLISNSAFKNVKYLTSVTIGTNVMAIGENCFENSSISTITFKSTTVPYLTSSNVFNTDIEGFTIYVPSAALSLYEGSNGFAKYAEYIVGK